MEGALFALLILIVLPALLGVVAYNGLVAGRNHCTEAWANIDTELKRRHELIPNLVETVKGYAKHERELLERVVQLRQQCLGENSPSHERAGHESEMGQLLSGLFVRVENYPELKANQNFLQLQKELINTEDRIQASLRFFNGNVRDYNNRVEQFPTNLIARTFGFESRNFFEVSRAGFRNVPEVKL